MGRRYPLAVQSDVKIGHIDLARAVYRGAVFIDVVAGYKAILFGAGIGPFYTVVPTDAVHRVIPALRITLWIGVQSGVGEGVPVLGGPFVDFFPVGHAHFEHIN